MIIRQYTASISNADPFFVQESHSFVLPQTFNYLNNLSSAKGGAL